MADSPAKRHHSRVLAALEAKNRAPGQLMAGATAYEQHMSELHGDRLRLKQVQSAAGKAELKIQLLPKYDAYLSGVLQADSGAQDEIVVTAMVWCIDAGNYRRALDLAAYVLRHKLPLPDRFSRTTGCLIAEEIAEAALSQQRTGKAFPVEVLLTCAQLVGDEDMPDEVRAKLFLALARARIARIAVTETSSDNVDGFADEAQAAVIELQHAVGLHSSCGGKKDLERAERLLKKFSADGA